METYKLKRGTKESGLKIGVIGVSDRRYRHPNGYTSWRVISDRLVGFIALASDEAQRERRHHAANIKRFLDDSGPCYWMDEDLEGALKNTECPKSIDIPKILNSFVVNFKKGLDTDKGTTIKWIVVTHVNREEVKQGDTDLKTQLEFSGEYDSFITVTGMDDDECFQHIRRIKQSSPGDDFKESRLDRNIALPEGFAFLDGNPVEEVMLSLALQSILILATRPELVSDGDEGSADSAKKRGEGFLKTKNIKKVDQYLNPRWIGRGYVNPRSAQSAKETHVSPITHWRIGHWRRQHHGKGKEQIKWIWIKPTLINAKMEGDKI